MNKTIAYVGIIAVVIIGLAGAFFLTAIGIDAGQFIGLFTTTLATAITAAVTLYGLQQVKDQSAKIGRSVNGNTSRLISLIQRDALTPAEAEEVARIENEARELTADSKGAHVA